MEEIEPVGTRAIVRIYTRDKWYTNTRGRLNDQRGRQVAYYGNECTHCFQKGHLKPQGLRKYPHLRPIQSTARPTDVSRHFFQALLCSDNRLAQPRRVLTDDRHCVWSIVDPMGLPAYYSRRTRALPEWKNLWDARQSTVVRPKPTDGIAGNRGRVYGPDKRTGSNPTERSLGMPETSGQSVSPVMRARARSMDVPVSRAKCAATKTTMVDASTVLLTSSTANVNTATVTVQIANERAMAVAGEETERYSTEEDRSATSSEIVPALVEEQQESVKEAAPTLHSIAVDKKKKIELAGTEMVNGS